MSTLTATGVRRLGRHVISLIETETGADVMVVGSLFIASQPADAEELDHLSRRAAELAANARAKIKAQERVADLPAVVSPAGCA